MTQMMKYTRLLMNSKGAIRWANNTCRRVQVGGRNDYSAAQCSTSGPLNEESTSIARQEHGQKLCSAYIPQLAGIEWLPSVSPE